MRNSIWILAASLFLLGAPASADAGNYVTRAGMKLISLACGVPSQLATNSISDASTLRPSSRRSRWNWRTADNRRSWFY